MNFFGEVVGGAIKGAEDVTKTGAEVAGGVVGGTAAVAGGVVGGTATVVGGAVEGTGKVIETVGEVLSGKKKEKRGLKEVILDDLRKDGYIPSPVEKDKVDDKKDYKEEALPFDREQTTLGYQIDTLKGRGSYKIDENKDEAENDKKDEEGALPFDRDQSPFDYKIETAKGLASYKIDVKK